MDFKDHNRSSSLNLHDHPFLLGEPADNLAPFYQAYLKLPINHTKFSMPKEYTIRSNCALPGESFAAETVLDLHYPIPTKEVYEGSDDTNKYILGRIGGHNVLDTCLPAGQSSAAAVAIDIPQPSVVATNQRQNKVETCQSTMQRWWGRSIRKNLGLPDGYHNVDALLINWDDEIDQLEVKQEVNDIGELFKDTFNYQTYLVEATKPHNVSSIGGHNGTAGLHQPNLWRDLETPQALCQGNEGCYYDLPHNAILPFTYRKPVVQRGGFSKVYSVEIHPSYHNFSKGTQSEAELPAKLESVPDKPVANLAFDYSTKRYKVIGSLVDLIKWMGSLRLKGPLALAIWFASPVFADGPGSESSDCNRQTTWPLVLYTDLLSSYGITFPFPSFIATPSSSTFGSVCLIYCSAALVFHRFHKDDPYQNYLLVTGMFCGVLMTVASTNGAGAWGPFLVYVPGCVSIALAISAMLHRAIVKRHAQSSEKAGRRLVDAAHDCASRNNGKENGE